MCGQVSSSTRIWILSFSPLFPEEPGLYLLLSPDRELQKMLKPSDSILKLFHKHLYERVTAGSIHTNIYGSSEPL